MSDPVRLREDPTASADLRSVLLAARPTPRIPAAIALRTRPAPRRSRSLWPAAAAGLLASLGWKPLAVAAGIGAAGATLLALRTNDPAPMMPPPPVASAIVSAPAPTPAPSRTLPVPTPPPETEEAHDAPVATSLPPPRRELVRRPALAPTMSAPPPAPPAPAESKAGRLDEEVRLLGEGRSALHADPARALAAADAHARQYPAGQLRLERELLAIDALERLGRTDRAQARARAALPSAKGSIYEARLRARAGLEAP